MFVVSSPIMKTRLSTGGVLDIGSCEADAADGEPGR